MHTCTSSDTTIKILAMHFILEVGNDDDRSYILNTVRNELDKNAYITSKRTGYSPAVDGISVARYGIKVTFTTAVGDPRIRKTLFKLRFKYPDIILQG
jgi:hypothetical protein